jgi:murein DD-endopeptidase MepM/ murein hydrolase activator NlpD
MERIKHFLREKGFMLVLIACVLVAAAMGSWAVNTIRERLLEDLQGEQTEQEEQQEETILTEEESEAWQQETVDAAGEVKNVPQPSPTTAPKPSNASSGASSGSASVREPLELHTESEPIDAAAASACAPVSGQVISAYSGDDLIYNKTLNDWRTHNGTDYACTEGESVFAPVSGTIEQVGTDGNWGDFIIISDSNGRSWKLCGVSDAKVKSGEAVTMGQTLGEASVIGCENALGVHIHMEITENGKYTDPAELLG